MLSMLLMVMILPLDFWWDDQGKGDVFPELMDERFEMVIEYLPNSLCATQGASPLIPSPARWLRMASNPLGSPSVGRITLVAALKMISISKANCDDTLVYHHHNNNLHVYRVRMELFPSLLLLEHFYSIQWQYNTVFQFGCRYYLQVQSVSDSDTWPPGDCLVFISTLFLYLSNTCDIWWIWMSGNSPVKQLNMWLVFDETLISTHIYSPLENSCG